MKFWPIAAFICSTCIAAATSYAYNESYKAALDTRISIKGPQNDATRQDVEGLKDRVKGVEVKVDDIRDDQKEMKADIKVLLMRPTK